jgi:hypothetical protein
MNEKPNLAPEGQDDAGDAERVLAARIATHFANEPVPRPTLQSRTEHAERFSWREAARRLLRVIDSL